MRKREAKKDAFRNFNRFYAGRFRVWLHGTRGRGDATTSRLTDSYSYTRLWWCNAERNANSHPIKDTDCHTRLWWNNADSNTNPYNVKQQ